MPEINQLHAGASATTADGHTSHIVALIVDPKLTAVTHLVIRNADISGTGRLVPLSHTTTHDDDRVTLDLTLAELLALDRFVVPGRLDTVEPADGLLAFWVGPPRGYTFAGHEQTPHPTDIIMRANPTVLLEDGHHLGTADELLLDPTTGTITGIRLHRGHLLTHRDLIVSADAISALDDTGIRLKLDHAAINHLQSTDKSA